MNVSDDDSSRRQGARKPPEAIQRLGLALPVTEADVKQAYFRLARETHPDHGGDPAQFQEVHRAFVEALEFAKRSGKRLPWIGAQMACYVAQIDATELVESLGGTVRWESLDWLEDTVGGDFAQLADRLKEVDLAGRPVTDADLARLLADPAHLPFLETVNLARTPITEASAGLLARLPNLKHLNLRGTRVSPGLRRQLARMPGVERVEGSSRFGAWFGRG